MGLNMVVALAQMNTKWEDKPYNYKKAESMIRQSAEEKADVLFFPEMSFTGFSMNVGKIGESEHETENLIRKYAKKYRIHIGFGNVRTKGDKGENHYSIISPSGRLVLDYIKIHPFSYGKENEYFVAGNNIETCRLDGFAVTPFICYDLRFPEIFQAMPNDTNLVLVAANWPESRREHWKILLRARAIENQVFVAGVNCTGKVGDLSYSGDSCFISPNGDLLSSLEYEEGILYCKIGDEVSQQRQNFSFRQDRRKSLYKTWYMYEE